MDMVVIHSIWRPRAGLYEWLNRAKELFLVQEAAVTNIPGGFIQTVADEGRIFLGDPCYPRY
jgi:hypothetical protein